MGIRINGVFCASFEAEALFLDTLVRYLSL